MAKKRSWFNLVKRFFISDKSKPEKEKKWRWVFGKQRTAKRITGLKTTKCEERERKIQSVDEEKMSKNALSVAVASTSAAEAAVAAAKVAVEVALRTQSSSYEDDDEFGGDPEFPAIKIVQEVPQSALPCKGGQIHEFAAAIRIQTAFRGYLARKALRALKGIVRLQAIIRGRAVRRQAITTLKCLQSIVNIQSQVGAKRFQTAPQGIGHSDQHKPLQYGFRDKIVKMQSSCERRWDDSLLSKKEADALDLTKKEALHKRERIKEFSFNHRRSAESERKKVNGRWRYWLDQWVDTQLSKSKEMEDLDSNFSPSPKPKEGICGGKPLRLRNMRENNHPLQPSDQSPISTSPKTRPSHHRKQHSLGENFNAFASSPVKVIPTYMAATESAKAKTRSLSLPKTRTFDTFSEGHSPYKTKLLSLSITTDHVPSNGKIGMRSSSTTGFHQQRSPSLKGVPGPIKSNRMLNDLSIDSGYSLPNWDIRQNGFR